MPKYTIGVDFGTLSGRAVVIGVADGRQIADCAADYPHAVISGSLPGSADRLSADYALQHPRDYIHVLGVILRGVIEKSAVDPADIIGIGIDFTTCTLLPVRADGSPLCFEEKYKNNPHAYVKLWKHHAAQPYADRINAAARERGEAWLGRYGGKISSEWLFPKLWQVLEEAPEVYADAAYFIEAGDWLTWQLTGRQTRGYVFAAYKGLYLEETGGYPSEDFLASLDERLRHVVRDKLDAPIIRTGERAGYVSEEASRHFGLPAGIAVACPLPDAHTAPIALGLERDGDMCAILGTSSCYMLLSEREVSVPGICGSIRDGLTPGFFGHEAGLCCFGDHFAWSAENAVSPEYAAEAKERGISMLRLLLEKAALRRPGEHGLIALNWFNGNRTPLVDASLSGIIIGLTLRTRPEDILRALIEATAYGTRLVIENFGAHGAGVGRIIAAGGIARKDPFTMQLFADVLKRDIEISDTAQAPALSGAVQAAAAAGEGAGGYASVRDAMRRMGGRSDRVYHPNPEASIIYDRLFEEYVKLFDYFGRGENNVMGRLRDISAYAGYSEK